MSVTDTVRESHAAERLPLRPHVADLRPTPTQQHFSDAVSDDECTEDMD